MTGNDNDSATTRKHCASNADGLLLTKNGRVFVGHNDINAKHGASYCNADNTTRLFGRALTLGLGPTCRKLGMALFGATFGRGR
jgi:hypothetical protein